MKALAALLVLTATGATLTARGSLLGVPGTISLPLPAVAALVTVTGFGVWAAMSLRRIAVRFGRLQRQRDELQQALEQERLGRLRDRTDRQDLQDSLRREQLDGQELRDRVQILERILAESARFNATRSLTDLPARLAVALAEVSGFGKVVVYLWSDAAGTFTARGFHGLSEASIAGLTGLQVTREEYEATCRSARARGGCYLVDRAGAGPDRWAGDAAAGEPWSAERLLLVPLTTPDGETLGYATMDDPRDRRVPGPVRLRLLEFLAYQGTIALESARVYDRLARNNAELARASDKLGSLAEMKANFVANVSHELRTPLTSISAYTELLQARMEEMSDGERREFLQVIHNESVKLTGIIDDILEINEMDGGRPELACEETDLVSMVRHLEDSWRSRARERNITLEVRADADRITLPADAALLNQLLGKLVSNAFKFNHDGGRVTITLAETGTAVRITVEDTGIGIPEPELGMIFERFYQVDSSPTREHNGQGLGLAICHDIVSHHDGRIWAENIKPHGARFTVLLPRRPRVHQTAVPEQGLRLAVEPGEFIQRLMHWVAESLAVRTVSLMIPDGDGDKLEIRAAIGLPEAVVQGTRIRRGVGVAGRVWASGRTLLVSDVSADPAFAGENDTFRYATPSLLCVPLKSDGSVTGVLAVNNRHDGKPLDEDDRLLLEALAPHLATMLEGCRDLYGRARRFEIVRESLRTVTPVGHLPRESVLDVCREICLAAGRRIMLAEEDLHHLAFTLRFYDVGMSVVPPQLLNRPGPLSDAETAFVQKHVQAGLEILEPLVPEPKVRQLVLHHHENYDGSGYPDGLAGETIPLGARLIRLTDTLAALLSPRPWRPALDLDDALREIRRGVGREFCPRMAEVFFQETLARRERIEALQDLPGDHLDLVRPGLDQQGMITLPV